jgi:hypothetical membrane protein
MKPTRLFETFRDRFPLIGPTMWMLSVQYFIIQIVVARDWAMGYSISHNTISDLGNTACMAYGGRFVCSPLHSLMNASFIILGIFMALGAKFIYLEFKKTPASLAGFSFMSIAGIGTILVGTFPENTISDLHVLGAFLPFFIGNIGIVILGLVLNIPKSLRIYSIFSGCFSLLALVFFFTHSYLGLGIGGMERLTAYPQTIWLIVFGIYISKNHFLKRSSDYSKNK